MDPSIKPGYQRLLLRLKQRRAKAQEKINKTLNKIREEKTLEKISQGLRKLSLDTENVYLYTPALYQRAFTAINSTLYDFLSYEEYIFSPENVEELHAMRIAGKKLRYSIELFAPIYKQTMIPYVQIMKDIQDQLGNIHDDDVWISWLPKFIDQEKSRIEDFFGTSSPIDKLLPGIASLIEDRTNARSMEYEAFLTTWKTHKDENTWPVLDNIINMPMRFEVILQDLAAEEAYDLEMEPVEVEEVEAELDVDPLEEQVEEVEETFDEAPEMPTSENEGDPDDDQNVWVHLDEPPQTP
jgi:CHAD domain-containing protein